MIKWVNNDSPEKGTSLSKVGPMPLQRQSIPSCRIAFLTTENTSKIKVFFKYIILVYNEDSVTE